MQAWEDFLKKQEAPLGQDGVNKWLRSLKIVHFDSGNLYLEAKDSFQALWFEEHIRPLLKSQFLNNNYRPIKVHLTVGHHVTASKSNKKEKQNTPPPIHFFRDKLEPSFTFENFVTAEANHVIFRLFCELTGFSLEVDNKEKPKIALGTWNPIYLWGGSGTGKTHLLMALSHEFKKRGYNALYAKAETFTEHVVAAIRASEMQTFRKTYRDVDILLIDDVHLFARKDATQEEFFHTFNTLHTTGRQIILSSKCTPAHLEDIEPRLISRFEWGINFHLEHLNPSDLKKVLQKRSETLHFPLSEEVLSFITQTFTSSRSLNKALEALILRCHLESDARYKRDSRLIDPELAQRLLADLCSLEKNEVLSPEKIIFIVSTVYGIRKEDLLGKSQAQEYSLPRQIAMYLCRQHLRLPYQKIGRFFGRDHSTVMTSIQQIEKKITSSDPELLSSLSEIKTKIEF